MIPFTNKDPDERIRLGLNFVNDLNTGETITAARWEVLTEDLEVEHPEMLDGAVDFSHPPVVYQWIVGGEHGIKYLHKAIITTSDGRILVLSDVQLCHTGVIVHT